MRANGNGYVHAVPTRPKLASLNDPPSKRTTWFFFLFSLALLVVSLAHSQENSVSQWLATVVITAFTLVFGERLLRFARSDRREGR